MLFKNVALFSNRAVRNFSFQIWPLCRFWIGFYKVDFGLKVISFYKILLSLYNYNRIFVVGNFEIKCLEFCEDPKWRLLISTTDMYYKTFLPVTNNSVNYGNNLKRPMGLRG